MTDKLLIYEQNYDMLDFNVILDQDQLEDYIQEWIEKYIKRHSTIKIEYRSHKIANGTVSIQLFQNQYEVMGRLFPAKVFYDGFNFIELEKMPTWKKTSIEN